MPRRAIKIPFERVCRWFHVPISEAARQLGLCVTLLKRMCRQNGVERWPHKRQKNGRRGSISSIKSKESRVSDIKPTITKKSASPTLSLAPSARSPSPADSNPLLYLAEQASRLDKLEPAKTLPSFQGSFPSALDARRMSLPSVSATNHQLGLSNARMSYLIQRFAEFGQFVSC
eukprot:EC716804.1.p1 GENE.EC716804.1~~EC716804.1.p1  ORF type:complete len:174 (+),score=22.81 EC716804.1:53-574(+)